MLPSSLPLYRRRGYTRRRDDVVAKVVERALRDERPAPSRSGLSLVPGAGQGDGIEVIRLLPAPAIRAGQDLVAHVEVGVQRILRPALAGIGGEVVLALAYSTTGIAVRRRDRLPADTRALASGVRQTMNRLVVGGEPIVLVLPIPWVRWAHVTLVQARRDGFHVAQSPDDVKPDLDAFVAQAIATRASNRGPGSSPVGVATLAIDARFPDGGELAAAFRRAHDVVPWARVYHVLGETATRVFPPGDPPGAHGGK